MASNISLSLLITIMATLIFSTVQADQQLVDKLCGATSTPDKCKGCIVDGSTATEVDVLTDILNGCADKHVNGLDTDIMNILNDKATDEKTKKALTACQPSTNGVGQESRKVLFNVSQKDLDGAKTSITGTIFPKIEDCTNVLRNSRITVPDPVSTGLSDIVADYNIILQIISSIA